MGRRPEVRQALALLAESPLLTLVGPPGIGKTRLAIQVAGEAEGSFAGVATFVDLTRLRGPELVAKAILESLGLMEQRDRSPVETVADSLAHGRALILLDNCEHVAAEVARVATRLLQRCPELALLATSREPLGIAAEIAWSVPPLSVLDARRLFQNRSSSRGLAVAAGAAVDLLCERLGRVPLAIELAAAGAEVGDDLEELLVRGPEAAGDALRAVTEWSHDRLRPEDRVLLRRLSVFSGPFKAEAARVICGSDPLDPTQIPAQLASLAAHSMVSAAGDGFALLQPLRAFAQSRLVESAEAAIMLRRHAEHYLELAEAGVMAPTVDAQVAGLHAIGREHINIRAALDWLQVFDHPKHLRLVALMGQFWNVNGHFAEARIRYQTALDLSPPPTRARAEVLQCLAGAAFEVGEYATALDAAAESLEIGRSLDDHLVVGDSLAWLGLALLARGDLDHAARQLREAIEEHRQAGSARGAALAGFFAGILASVRGELQPAMTLFESSLAGFRAGAAAFYTGQALVALGQTAVLAGELGRAENALREGIPLLRRLESAWSLALALDAVAGLAARRGETKRGLTLAGAAESMRGHLSEGMPGAYEPILGALLGPAWAELSEADAQAALSAGRALSLDAAIRLALG